MSSSLLLKGLLFPALLLCLIAQCVHAEKFCGKDNCFELLGLKREASKADVRRAYRRLSVELHPDKRPDDKEAAYKMSRISLAYETLKDDGKRAMYEDYLDNPAKYWDVLLENETFTYAPKSNVFFVITFLTGVMTVVHWLNMNHNYRETRKRMRESQEFKRQVSKLVKTKQAASREEAEAMINVDIVGLEEPDWRNLIIFRLARLPVHAAKYASWNIKWIVSYKVLKKDYSDSDKHYLIRKNLDVSEEQWNSLSEKEVATFVTEQLWDKEKSNEYIRMKQIELNRLGKGKKKKKHTAIPYSEAEEVSMNE